MDRGTDSKMDQPRSARTTVRRGAQRAVYDERILAVLDAGLIAHVGVNTADGPIVLPMAYARTDDVLYLHGAVGNALLGAATDVEVCVTVTLVDALVIARSPFHNSMNYRSVVVRGVATRVAGAEQIDALRRISDHVVANWDQGRAPTDAELRRTLVLAVPLDEASAKIRSGDPIDEAADVGGPHWAGIVPIASTWSAPVPAADLPAGIEPPGAVSLLTGRPLP